MMKNAGTVWLLGAYGNGNLGDDMLGDLARRSLESAGLRPKVFAGEFFPFTKDSDHGRRAIVANLSRRDRLLIVGGGLLNDHFGHGFLMHFASLAVALRLKGIEHSFVGIGVEGFRTKLGAILARVALGLARSVSVRDQPSKTNIERIGGTAEVIPDVGWLARRHLPAANISAARQLVVFTIAIENESFRSTREEVIRVAAAEVLQKTDKDVVLVAMQTSSVPALDDYRSLCSIQRALASSRVSVSRPENYRDLYAVLQEASVVGGYRLHAGVLGAIAGSRVVAVSRSHKVREALSMLPQCSVVDEESIYAAQSLSFGSRIVEACLLPAVADEAMQILDSYCEAIELELVNKGSGVN